MECCVGLIVITILVVGGILVSAQIMTAIANRKREEWARTLTNASLLTLENTLAQLEREKHALERERLLYSGHKRTNIDVKIGETNTRIKIVESFIKEQGSTKFSIQ